jgi:hypothetical protein
MGAGPESAKAPKARTHQRSRQKSHFLPAAKYPVSAATFCGQINQDTSISLLSDVSRRIFNMTRAISRPPS